MSELMFLNLRPRARTFRTHLGCQVVERKRINAPLGVPTVSIELSCESPKQERERLNAGRVWSGARS